MVNHLKCVLSYIRHKLAWPLLAFVWLSGLVLGMVCAVRHGYLANLIFRSVEVCSGVPELLFSVTFPFLISGLAVRLSEPWLLPLFVGAKAFSFGFCACGTILAFGTGSWVVRFFFLFGDWMIAVPFLLYSGRRFAQVRELPWELLLCVAFSIVVFVLDYFVISPFLVSLFG